MQKEPLGKSIKMSKPQYQWKKQKEKKACCGGVFCEWWVYIVIPIYKEVNYYIL